MTEVRGPIGRCNICLEVKELVLEEMRSDPDKPIGPWIRMRYCQTCCDGDELRRKMSEELNP